MNLFIQLKVEIRFRLKKNIGKHYNRNISSNTTKSDAKIGIETKTLVEGTTYRMTSGTANAYDKDHVYYTHGQGNYGYYYAIYIKTATGTILNSKDVNNRASATIQYADPHDKYLSHYHMAAGSLMQ